MAFHFQKTVTDWPRAVAKLPAGANVKAVDHGDILRDAKAANPAVKTTLRHWYDQGQVFGGSLETNKQRARDFFATFIDGTFLDQYAPYVDYVEEWNEYNASSHNAAEIAERVTWARAVAEVWSEMRQADSRLAHIRLVLGNIAVGNDLPRDYAVLALQHDAVLGYHAYDHWQAGQRDPQSWRYHCGRWHFMEQAWGLKPRWLFTECGPYAGVLEGWRHPGVLGGDAGRYVEAVRTWIREVKGTPAYAEGRVLGFHLFTSGRAGDTWQHYWTEQPELDALAEMTAAEWTPVAAPPPPPPPPPTEPDPPSPAFVQDIIATLPVNVASPWYPYATRPLSAIKSIVVHHSEGAASGTALQAAQYHTQTRGWPGIGYHFWVTNSGVVQKTNLLTTHSFHAGAANGTSIGVCLAGSFTATPPPPAQLAATRDLLAWLKTALPGAALVRHGEVAATECPGATWPQWWDQLVAPPPAPEPGVPYVVVANLLPQTATQEQVAHVLAATYPQRQTVLFSADDAARLVAPGLPGSKVKVWGDWPGIVPWLQERGVSLIESWDWPGDGAWGFPIGTAAERAAAVNGWPGKWVDANPYGNPYQIGGGTAYHTGADLNLNSPHWDADKDAPVYAAAAGVVTYAAKVPAPSTWGRLVVIRHELPDGKRAYTRYAHLGSLLVAAGQAVTRGQQIGTIGGAEFGLPNHLHFDISPTERLATAPLDWPGMTWSRIVTDYTDPLRWILDRT